MYQETEAPATSGGFLLGCCLKVRLVCWCRDRAEFEVSLTCIEIRSFAGEGVLK